MKRAAVETFDPRPTSDPAEARIAVTLPCYNEAATIARVIEDFRAALPGAEIYVFDNNSTDATAQIARDRIARSGAKTPNLS